MNVNQKRCVVVHFHLYKNAGTSIDKILHQNFGSRWKSVESKDGKVLSSKCLAKFIISNPNMCAVSSHTAEVSIPKVDGINIIPIVFLRDPLDRIRSVYDFERRQLNDNMPAYKIAKSGNFLEYYRWRLESGAPWQILNFQSFKLRNFHQKTKTVDTHLYRNRSIRAIKSLPYVGVVETFDESMLQFEIIIKKSFPDFRIGKVHENSTPNRGSLLKARLRVFRQEIGSTLYNNLLQLNATDKECYEIVRKLSDEKVLAYGVSNEKKSL